jgi:hypothetical protein
MISLPDVSIKEDFFPFDFFSASLSLPLFEGSVIAT